MASRSRTKIGSPTMRAEHSGPGRRRWVFLEHGSTSMALLLFVVCFSGENIFPVGMIVVLLQSLLLTLVEWKGKGLWVKPPADAAEH